MTKARVIDKLNRMHRRVGQARGGTLGLRKRIKVWEHAVAVATPQFGQCRHLIKLFGGVVPFAVAVQVHPKEIIRDWLVSGLIPCERLMLLMKRARYFGILLRPHDLYPDFLTEDGFKDYTDLMAWVNNSGMVQKCKEMRSLEHQLTFLA